jgi:hypothetical protein
MEKEYQLVSTLLLKLQARLDYFAKRSNARWAGCCSEGHPGDSDEPSSAYVVEPKISIRNAREARALILVIAREGKVPDSLYPLLIAYQERIWKFNEPIYIKLKIALQFLLDRRFNNQSPIREAIEAILGFHHRSFFGNDLRLAAEVLRRSELKIRALQRSKIRRAGLPKRPKERAEPAHRWLPSWQKQFDPWLVDFSAEEDPVWELVSPAEVAFHFGRLA